ncbi:hypothetical protein HDV62DRAFT_8212 [Trichoderma sp. SZMC 28011]
METGAMDGVVLIARSDAQDTPRERMEVPGTERETMSAASSPALAEEILVGLGGKFVQARRKKRPGAVRRPPWLFLSQTPDQPQKQARGGDSGSILGGTSPLEAPSQMAWPVALVIDGYGYDVRLTCSQLLIRCGASTCGHLRPAAEGPAWPRGTGLEPLLCPRRHVQAWRWVPSYLVEPVSLAWFLDVNALALSCFFFPAYLIGSWCVFLLFFLIFAPCF